MMHSKSDNTAEEQASHWQAQLSSDLITEQTRHDFAAWLAESPSHQAAWRKVNTFWRALDNVTAAELNLQVHPVFTPVNFMPAKTATRNFYRPAAGIAAAILIAVAILVARPFDYYLSDYRTGIGEQRQISLADGSQVVLNTQSAISVDYQAQNRRIFLHSGEAYFKVAADAKRPFIVDTDMGQTQALGTAFEVKLFADKTMVTVFEHAVNITTSAGQILTKLAEGERAVFTEDKLSATEKIDTARAESWRKQRMVFQNRKLADVVAELERYRSGRIVILGSSIKNLRLTGVFGTENTDIALRTIEQTLPVKISRFTDKLVVLAAK